MFSLIEKRSEIAAAQKKLESTLSREFRHRAVKDIGYPGGTTFDARIIHNETFWFWSADYNESETPNPRRLNWFGLFNEDEGLQISVEINTPYEGRNDQVAGFFARDNESGSVYLMHSGRVGGGHKGVSRSAFLTWSNERLDKVIDASGGIKEGVLVMPVEGASASRSATRYVGQIAKFKDAVRAGVTESPDFQHQLTKLEDFYAESRGRRQGRRSNKIDYLSRHGEIVDALHEWRRAGPMPKGARLVKNILIDLGVARGSELIEVFEVKTDTARTNLYSAIGQLMVHGTANGCRRVMVLPQGNIPDDLKAAFGRLGIELLRFELDGEKTTISSVKIP